MRHSCTKDQKKFELLNILRIKKLMVSTLAKNNAKILKLKFINHLKLTRLLKMKLLEEQFLQVIFLQFKDYNVYKE